MSNSQVFLQCLEKSIWKELQQNCNTGGSFQYPGGGFSWVPELHNRTVLGLLGACLGAVLELFWVAFWSCQSPLKSPCEAPSKLTSVQIEWAARMFKIIHPMNGFCFKIRKKKWSNSWNWPVLTADSDSACRDLPGGKWKPLETDLGPEKSRFTFFQKFVF